MGVSTMQVEPLDATFGAVVRGVRLAALDDEQWRAVEDAFHEFGILVFPGQHLTEDEQQGFGRRFGPLETIGKTQGLAPITNQRADGSLRTADDPIMHVLKGNEGWHTDSSYMPVAARASMLSAHVVPSSGGHTEFADMRAAYDALDDGTKARIADLRAYHSIVWSQTRLGFTEARPGTYGYDVAEPPLRPLVRVHPVTGRRSLFIGRHAHAIPGLAPEESERLLDDLLEFACRPPRVYEHHWQVGDLVVWDNRCMLHRARPWDLAEARLMKHTRVSGDPILDGAPA